jgi:thimet oligopeptidase
VATQNKNRLRALINLGINHGINLGLTLGTLSVVFGCQVRNPARPGLPYAPPAAEKPTPEKPKETQVDTDPIVVRPLKATPDAAIRLVRSDYAKGDVKRLCAEAIKRADDQLNELAKQAPEGRTLDNTVLSFEKILADLGDETGPLTFMGYVATDEGLRAEGSACEEELGAVYVAIMTRRDIYDAIKDQTGRNRAELRLVTQTLRGFEQNGLKLPNDKLQRVKELQTQLSQKTAKYQSLLNNDVSTVEFKLEELAGAPASFLARLKTSTSGKLIVTTKGTDYLAVMENCSNEQTRKAMQLAYFNRGGAETVKLLEEAVILRQQIAKLLGFSTWAEYRTQPRMVQNADTVEKFLENLKGKLSEGNQNDFAQLLRFKKELDPTATALNQWDIAYMGNQLKKRDFAVDDEMIREFFPANSVVSGLFSVYSEMLGVSFLELTDAKVWAPGVKLFEIRNKSDGRLIGFFYADLYPRPGKYGHAAAFPLISGRMLPEGYYSLPVAAMVTNMAPPSANKPSLLSHDEVETLFHEFGHIMHQTLTRAPYASLSGSGVAQDFVEAPSQMLENWVWQKDILNRISGHYSDQTKKLPDELLQKMLNLKDFQQASSYTKQLLYGTFDFSIHTQEGPVDVTKTYDDLYRGIMKQEPIEGGHFPGSFGHMMGGYDAGYYSYLWSKVFAQDMFTLFKEKGVTSPEVGMKYRQIILERGNMQDASVLLRDFLGREPSNKAFYDDLHI